MSPADDVVVRPLRADDVEPALSTYVAVAAEGRWVGREVPFDLDIARNRFASSVDDPDQYATVAESRDPVLTGGLDPSFRGLVGLLHLGIAPYGVAELGMHVVSPARGRGVGRALMADAVRWAEDQPRVHKIALQVWPHNEAALRLYRAFGFEQEGYLRRHYRRRSGELWDAVVMGRPV